MRTRIAPDLGQVLMVEIEPSESEGRRVPAASSAKHLGDGRWWDEERQAWRDGRGRPLPRQAVLDGLTARSTKVVLATAHLDHDPTHNPGRNLKALCQRCHMIHDRPEHRRRRSITLRMRKAIGDLFTGPYL